MLVGITILTLLGSLALVAKIYKCEVNGQTVFSQTHGAKDAKELESDDLNKDSGLGITQAEVEQRAFVRETLADQFIDNEFARIRRDAGRRFDVYERNMRGCEAEAARALNKLAGATYEASQRECINKH